MRASRVSASYGARVAVAESGRFGGTCVNVGCIPKKLFSYAAHFREDLDIARGYGWTVGEPRFDWPTLLANKGLTMFICDYCRLIIIGNARAHEIEALMDEEIQTITHDKMKPYHALSTMGDAFPAIGIVAAVLGVIKAMGAINESPEILGGKIAAALVGTLLGVFLSYSIVSPVIANIKSVRTKQNRLYVIVKQTLLAYMNGSVPQVALEHGRKTISAYERPTIDAVEQEMMNPGGDQKAA